MMAKLREGEGREEMNQGMKEECRQGGNTWVERRKLRGIVKKRKEMKWALEKPTGRGRRKGERKTAACQHSLVDVVNELAGPAFQIRVLLEVVPPSVLVSAPGATGVCKKDRVPHQTRPSAEEGCMRGEMPPKGLSWAGL